MTQSNHQEEEIVKEFELVEKHNRNQGEYIILLIVLPVCWETSGPSSALQCKMPPFSRDDAAKAASKCVASWHFVRMYFLLVEQRLVLVATAVVAHLDVDSIKVFVSFRTCGATSLHIPPPWASVPSRTEVSIRRVLLLLGDLVDLPIHVIRLLVVALIIIVLVNRAVDSLAVQVIASRLVVAVASILIIVTIADVNHFYK